MSVRLTLRFDVLQDALEEHLSSLPVTYPLVAEPSEWTWDDLAAAVADELVMNVEVVDAEQVSP